LYDIRPGNGAGQILQPRSPHGAIWPVKEVRVCWGWQFYWGIARLIAPDVFSTSVIFAPIKSRMETYYTSLPRLSWKMAVKQVQSSMLYYFCSQQYTAYCNSSNTSHGSHHTG